MFTLVVILISNTGNVVTYHNFDNKEMCQQVANITKEELQNYTYTSKFSIKCVENKNYGEENE